MLNSNGGKGSATWQIVEDFTKQMPLLLINSSVITSPDTLNFAIFDIRAIVNRNEIKHTDSFLLHSYNG